MEEKIKSLKKWYYVIAAVVTLIFSVATADSDVVKKNYILVRDWYYSTPAMSGSWSSRTENDNENTISANEWLENDDQTVLDLDVYDGKFDGVISTPAIRSFIRMTPQINDYFLLEGTKNPFSKSGTGYVYEYIMGKKYLFAVLDIRMKDGNLTLTDKSKGGSKFVPKEVILLKRSDKAFDERLKAHGENLVMDKVEQLKQLKSEPEKSHK